MHFSLDMEDIDPRLLPVNPIRWCMMVLIKECSWIKEVLQFQKSNFAYEKIVEDRKLKYWFHWMYVHTANRIWKRYIFLLWHLHFSGLIFIQLINQGVKFYVLSSWSPCSGWHICTRDHTQMSSTFALRVHILILLNGSPLYHVASQNLTVRRQSHTLNYSDKLAIIKQLHHNLTSWL